jgi:rhodanese-related sulfurtransferase
MKMFRRLLATALLTVSLSLPALAEDVMIDDNVKSVTITLNDETFTIERNQDKTAHIHELYATTFRGKPQPIKLAEGVETVGELELIEYMVRAQVNKDIVILDTRTPGWYASLRIPGTINIPNSEFENYDDAVFNMTMFMGVKQNEDNSLDFSEAKTVVGYCNGFWCGQTPSLIKHARYSLLNMGYPAEKIKYYRGGMQAWAALGLTMAGDNANSMAGQ